MTDLAPFREAVLAWASGGTGDQARELAARPAVRTVVLVEGPSDVAAVDALAAARGRDLAAEGVCVLAMGGAMSVARFVRLLGPDALGLRLTGLCDAGEQRYFARAFAQAGAEFFVCAADLEEELIRALGVPRVQELIAAEGELGLLRALQQQPAQRDREPAAQVRRFFGSKKGRKIRYGRVLVEALSPNQVPAPLAGLLALV